MLTKRLRTKRLRQEYYRKFKNEFIFKHKLEDDDLLDLLVEECDNILILTTSILNCLCGENDNVLIAIFKDNTCHLYCSILDEEFSHEKKEIVTLPWTSHLTFHDVAQEFCHDICYINIASDDIVSIIDYQLNQCSMCEFDSAKSCNCKVLLSKKTRLPMVLIEIVWKYCKFFWA
jgi:hypothetical protein